jgi:hypothetical protein
MALTDICRRLDAIELKLRITLDLCSALTSRTLGEPPGTTLTCRMNSPLAQGSDQTNTEVSRLTVETTPRLAPASDVTKPKSSTPAAP